MVDCNNQYGWAMSQFLPTGGFKWIKEEDTPLEEDKTVEEWEDFIKSQNVLHDTVPCAPEHKKINEELLSDYQKELSKKLGVKYGGNKLCLTLDDKKEYV